MNSRERMRIAMTQGIPDRVQDSKEITSRHTCSSPCPLGNAPLQHAQATPAGSEGQAHRGGWPALARNSGFR